MLNPNELLFTKNRVAFKEVNIQIARRDRMCFLLLSRPLCSLWGRLRSLPPAREGAGPKNFHSQNWVCCQLDVPPATNHQDGKKEEVRRTKFTDVFNSPIISGTTCSSYVFPLCPEPDTSAIITH